MVDDATLCILAGGEGRRMGQPKAEIRIGGKPILLHLLDGLRWSGPTMLVTAPGREHPAGCERFHQEVFDPVAGEGPLRGLLTALEYLSTPIALLLSVDMPIVNAEPLEFLLRALQADPMRLGVMLRRERIEPFPSIWRREAIDTVRRCMSAGPRSLVSLAEAGGVVVVDAPADWDVRIWTNLNTPDDVARFEKP